GLCHIVLLTEYYEARLRADPISHSLAPSGHRLRDRWARASRQHSGYRYIPDSGAGGRAYPPAPAVSSHRLASRPMRCDTLFPPAAAVVPGERLLPWPNATLLVCQAIFALC